MYHTTIENCCIYIKRLGLVKKLDICVPYELKEIHAMKRINICDKHFKRNAVDPFFETNYHWQKNRSSTITLIEKLRGPRIMNQHKPY